MKFKLEKQVVWILIAISSVLFVFTSFNMNFRIDIPFSRDLTQKEIEWIKDQGALIYAADRNAPPLRFQDEADGQYKGILIDYMNSLSLELGTNIELHPMLWENALKSLSKGETDISDMFASKERAKHYLFSKPIYNLRAVLAVRADSVDIKKLDHLNGKIMAVQKGDYASEFIQNNYPNIIQHHVADLSEALLLLAEGKVDATLGDEPVMFYQLEENLLKDVVKIIDRPIYENPVVFAVPKSKPELIPILNKAIGSLNNKGVLEKIQQKWFGISTPIVTALDLEKIQNYIFISAIIFTIIFTLMVIWNNSLKKQVKIRTKELEDSRNDLQIVFDGMTEYMVVLDPNGKVVNINVSFLNYLEKDKKQVIGKQCDECLQVFSPVDLYSILNETLDTGEYYLKEKYIKNGVYNISSYPLKDTEENIKSVLVLIYDVTNDKISKNRILQANKMMAIGELAAGIAHEIRNPLGIVRNHSYIMRTSSSADTLINKSLDCIDSSIDRASRIIDNLLNFSRISGNAVELVDINLFINNLMDLQSKYMQRNGITYEVECVSGYNFLTNQESLKHIIINLVSNATDAINGNGKVTVKAYPDDQGMVIECIDTGSGINSSDIERIFNPFYTTKEPGKGTGLGLYITYNEVKKLKGDILVESKPSGGTKFKVHIPTIEGGMLE